LILPAGTKLPLALVRPLSVKSAKPGDQVYLQVTFPVTNDSQMVIPPGSYMEGTIATVTRRDRTRAVLAFTMRSARLTFSTGYTASVAGTADVQPITAELQMPVTSEPDVTAGRPDPMGMGAMQAFGTTAPPPPSAPSLGSGPKIAAIAVGVAAAATAIVAILLVHRADIKMRPGTPLEMVLAAPLTLDRDQVMAAVRQYTLQVALAPVAIVQPPVAVDMCYDPGTPGTPDIVIPGTPGTPPTVIPGLNGAPDTVIPGMPATPDTVIPGTPGTPGREYPCR
jgi:hypothetical protein